MDAAILWSACWTCAILAILKCSYMIQSVLFVLFIVYLLYTEYFQHSPLDCCVADACEVEWVVFKQSAFIWDLNFLFFRKVLNLFVILRKNSPQWFLLNLFCFTNGFMVFFGELRSPELFFRCISIERISIKVWSTEANI